MKNTVLLTLFLIFTISTFGEEKSIMISKSKSKKKSEKSATNNPNKNGRAGYLSISGGKSSGISRLKFNSNVPDVIP